MITSCPLIPRTNRNQEPRRMLLGAPICRCCGERRLPVIHGRDHVACCSECQRERAIVDLPPRRRLTGFDARETCHAAD